MTKVQNVHPNTTHGEALKTKEYGTWARMLRRCYNPNDNRYYSHGGRGIIVCDRWKNSYENFLKDVGRAPTSKHSLDRIDNNRNYEPSNCKWSTITEQANNKRNTYMVDVGGIKTPLGILCRYYNAPIELVRGRLNNGWDVETALTKPKKIKLKKL